MITILDLTTYSIMGWDYRLYGEIKISGDIVGEKYRKYSKEFEHLVSLIQNGENNDTLSSLGITVERIPTCDWTMVRFNGGEQYAIVGGCHRPPTDKYGDDDRLDEPCIGFGKFGYYPTEQCILCPRDNYGIGPETQYLKILVLFLASKGLDCNGTIDYVTVTHDSDGVSDEDDDEHVTINVSDGKITIIPPTYSEPLIFKVLGHESISDGSASENSEEKIITEFLAAL